VNGLRAASGVGAWGSRILLIINLLQSLKVFFGQAVNLFAEFAESERGVIALNRRKGRCGFTGKNSGLRQQAPIPGDFEPLPSSIKDRM